MVNDYPALAVAAEAPAMIDLLPMLREGGKRILARAGAAALKAKVKPKLLTREIVGGPAADAIVREARKQRADLIVLGTHGRRGVRRLVLGSDAEQVVRTSPGTRAAGARLGSARATRRQISSAVSA